MYVDSKKQTLNSGEIITAWLQNNPKQPHPMNVMATAILKELSEPNVKTKQFGNTIFEVILGQGDKAFFKAFNVDTGPNFLESSKLFAMWARKVLNLKVLVTEFDDPSLERLFTVIGMNPPMSGMGYQTMRMKSGKTRVFLNLGV